MTDKTKVIMCRGTLEEPCSSSSQDAFEAGFPVEHRENDFCCKDGGGFGHLRSSQHVSQSSTRLDWLFDYRRETWLMHRDSQISRMKSDSVTLRRFKIRLQRYSSLQA